jgi:hypothetical protein
VQLVLSFHKTLLRGFRTLDPIDDMASSARTTEPIRKGTNSARDQRGTATANGMTAANIAIERTREENVAKSGPEGKASVRSVTLVI